MPSSPRAAAIISSRERSDTPITWRRAPAGLVRGPRKLKIVRTPSARRTGTTYLIAAWCLGANMKPKPTASMQWATSSGSRSMRAPRASITSADPHWLVAERFPCLATRQPAPAATKAAVVDTLNVGLPPPVPAVSTRSSPAPRAGPATASSRPGRRSRGRSPPSCAEPRESGGLGLGGVSLHHLAQHARGLIGREVLAVGQPVDRVGENRVVVHSAERKLRSICLPWGVSTDSGWNCTPSIGSSEWRSPMITSSARADTFRVSGKPSGSTTSE